METVRPSQEEFERLKEGAVLCMMCIVCSLVHQKLLGFVSCLPRKCFNSCVMYVFLTS